MVASRPMERVEQPLSAPVVILTDGTFPSHPKPLTTLRNARTLICTDGSADSAIRHDLAPQFIIGDLDSLQKSPDDYDATVIQLPDQDSTDLEKALDWCIQKSVREITILGATGQRDDHTLANILILSNYSGRVKLSMLTDYAEINYVEESYQFSCEQGQKVSLLPLQEIISVTTEGLKYRLQDEPLHRDGTGISNEAVGGNFSVTVDSGGVFVFISYPE
ncbi:MAG: thiamine diphosphokinase [Candidatus Marinimicrobia bacterium]|nr:thiamine diphosphokinase [Candidatus Neomarinimicrobiota bacterium]MDP6593800.1 thiamine diphosphokinase [Candidatus Neomarinimicrobiota bacterium]